MEVNEETFKQLTVEEQRLAIFRAVTSKFVQCEARFTKLEKCKIVNTAAAFSGGLFGGILTILGKMVFWK